MAVAVVIDPRAPRAPGLSRAGHARFLRHFGEDSVLVVIQTVLSVVSDVEVFPAVVVVVAGANTLSPARRVDTCFDSNVGEAAVMIVAVEMVGGALARGKSLQRGAIDEKNIRPAIVVVIQDCNTGASGFDDVLLGVLPAEHVHPRQPGFLGDVGEVGNCVLGKTGQRFRLSEGHRAARRGEDGKPCPASKGST